CHARRAHADRRSALRSRRARRARDRAGRAAAPGAGRAAVDRRRPAPPRRARTGRRPGAAHPRRAGGTPAEHPHRGAAPRRGGRRRTDRPARRSDHRDGSHRRRTPACRGPARARCPVARSDRARRGRAHAAGTVDGSGAGRAARRRARGRVGVTPLAAIAELLRTRVGLDPRALGTAALAHAVRRRAKGGGLDGAAAYLDAVRDDTGEWDALLETVVVPETWFFRDREPFALLARWAARAYAQRSRHGPLAVLSLPCATGEEA